MHGLHSGAVLGKVTPRLGFPHLNRTSMRRFLLSIRLFFVLVASLLHACTDDLALPVDLTADVLNGDDAAVLETLDAPSEIAAADAPVDVPEVDDSAVDVPAETEVAPADAADVLVCADGLVAAETTGDGAACVLPCAPTTEICNGQDDDCDGVTDNGTCDDGNPCTLGDVCGIATCLPGPVTDCTDGDFCTTDSCDLASGCTHTVFLGPCNDKDACTSGDTCTLVSGGKILCTGASISCHDDNSCTLDTCDAAKGCIHTLLPVKTECDDNNACTLGDECDHLGNCLGAPIACSDGNVCTADLCDVSGTCTFAIQSGGPCSDSDPCTLGDACQAGVCASGAVQVCGDDNPCTDDSCDSTLGACVFAPNNHPCDDGDACTINDVCKSGFCISGLNPGCSDGKECTADHCNTTTGGCEFTALPNGVSCSDGLACTAGDVCASGACAPGPAPICADGNDCTSDGCDAASGACVFTALSSTPCSDGDVCSGNDLCTAGQCVPGANVCECKKGSDCAVKEDGDQCNGTLYCELSDHTCQLDLGTVVICDTSGDSECVKYSCDTVSGKCVAKNVNEKGVCNADGSICTGADFCQAGICISTDGPQCDDQNMCTNDSCDPISGCLHVGNDAPCEDGDSCTEGDACVQGSCVSGPGKICDDGSQCTKDFCIQGECESFPQSGTACSDGNLCTLDDTCSGGVCTPGIPKSCSVDGPCLVPTCDGTSGKCGSAAAYAYAPCQDGSECTLGDHCEGGKCKSGPVWCYSDDPCIVGSCDSTGLKCLFGKAMDGVSCNDGDACTLGDTCKSGACKAGTPKVCEAGQTCAQDVCESSSGACKPNADGIICDDNNACTLSDKCKNGACSFDNSVDCDDKNPCTTDTCNTVTAKCSHAAVTGPCDDGNVCTMTEQCVGGVCSSTLKLNCDDGNACTSDTCDPKLACKHVASSEGSACDDENPCTTNDKCTNLACLGTGPTCADDNPCTKDKCSLTTGCSHSPQTTCDDNNPCTTGEKCTNNKCSGGAVVVCDDGNPCTVDKCSGGGGCTFVGITGGSCSDGDPCTSGDHCQFATCIASISGCDDSNPCTVDACDQSAGCANTPTTAVPCTDGNACTANDVCLNGGCVSGDAVNCADGNVCTDDGCDPAVGCASTPVGGACDDGNACLGPDACDSGKCVGQTPISCDDSNVCTTDVCIPSDGCLNYPITASTNCDDGNPCTSSDACKSGICQGKAVINCNDGNYCTLDACSLGSGCSHSIQTGGVCDDGNVCTIGDKCSSAGVCQAGTSSGCDDANPCTTDACDAATGCKHTSSSTGQSTSVNVVGDTQVTVNGLNQTAMATWDQFSGWTHAVNGATWLWSTYLVQAPELDTQVAFARTFTIPPGAATLIGQLAIATDGAFVCLLNGKLVGVNTAEQNWLAPISQPLAGKLQAGSNTLSCTLVNPGKPGSTAMTNPAGLLFRIDATLFDASGALPCDDGNTCTTGDWCNGTTCTPGSLVSCDDLNTCTADACDPKKGCVHSASGLAVCTDGNPCTVSDFCSGATCKGGPALNCNDGNACTLDTCAASSGCSHGPANGASCEDGNPCTSGDLCIGTICASGGPNPCDDTNACTTDACSVPSGCYHTQAGGSPACTDNNPCTTQDVCVGSTCVGAYALNCDDKDACTIDSCDPGTGCFHLGTGGVCSDGNLCTSGDTCQSTGCTGTPVVCTDGNPCTSDGCQSQTGFCSFIFLSGPGCEDGNLCTLNDICKSGACTPGVLRNCADGDACTIDGCIPGAGTCTYSTAQDGTACEDNSLCTFGDACTAGTCHGTAKSCDDGQACTSDSCSPSSGLCSSSPLPDGTPCGTGGTCVSGGCQ